MDVKMSWFAGVVLGVCAAIGFGQAPTALTYQGVLSGPGGPVDDELPMAFRLFDAAVGGSPVGPTVSVPLVEVEGGVFTVSLDFGVRATGTRAMWLEVSVAGVALSPRQAIGGSPYSLQTRGVFVDGDGDVGIGTESPGADVDIAGAGTSVIVRSDAGPATVALRGPTPGGFGGTYSTLSFENGAGAERFGVSMLNVFGQDFLSLRPGDDPLGFFQVRADGKASMGDVPSIARLHVTDRDIGTFGDAMLNETAALEDNDAVFGIYSLNTGNFGSAIALAEVVGGSLVDKWGLVRTTSNTSPELRVTYGTDANYAQNPTSVAFTPEGIRFRDGSVGRWAGVVDGDSWVSSSSTDVTNEQFIGGPQVTVSASGQQVLVTGFATFQMLNDLGVSYRLAYRRVGMGFNYTQIGLFRISRSSDDSGRDRRNVGITSVVKGLSPGTYEFRLLVTPSQSGGTPNRVVGIDLSAIVF
ncbi:MAG: hypothetical protein AAF297_05155 [Planctomycetota bacterium]